MTNEERYRPSKLLSVIDLELLGISAADLRYAAIRTGKEADLISAAETFKKRGNIEAAYVLACLGLSYSCTTGNVHLAKTYSELVVKLKEQIKLEGVKKHE